MLDLPGHVSGSNKYDVWRMWPHNLHYRILLTLTQPCLLPAGVCCARAVPTCPPLCSPPPQLVDLGCGYGGTAVHIAKRLGCNAVGVNISPFQVRRECTEFWKCIVVLYCAVKDMTKE